jgi:phosphatidylserine/phosphatidylglycerophosphate/cardiolipin synthase-like enzyme
MQSLCLLLFLSLSPLSFAQAKEPITNYEVLFSPHDHVADELIALIGKEKKSVKAAVYCLMHHGIAKALIDAHKRGVRVEVIVDPYSIKARSPVKKMAEANLPVYVWNPQMPVEIRKGRTIKKRKPLMHDKFCVLGDNRVWTGSFNFTFEAEKNNQENVIVLENTGIADKYLKEFDRLKKAGCVAYEKFVGK